jgi:hypothetical protein
MADIWDELEDASGDGRGRPNTTIPKLEALQPGERETFGPYGSKGSANQSMRNAAKLDAAEGIVFRGPLYHAKTEKYYFAAERPE